MTKSGIFKYCVLAILACGGVSAIQIGLRKRLTFLTAIFFISSVMLVIIFTDAYGIEPYWIQVREVKIHDSALAETLGETRIVQITDVHLNRGLGFREKQLIQKVNALHPDVLFFTGDLFNKPDQIAPALELLKSFHVKTMVGVPGDTDLTVMNAHEYAKTLAPFMRVLLDDSMPLKMGNGHFVELLGIEQEQPQNLARALKTSHNEVLPRILLSPAPEIFEAAVERNINLVLTGDTHGGQVGFDFLIHLSNYANRSRYMRGLFHQGNTKMYVNRGIGTTTRAMRFFCRPEIAIFKVTA